MAPYEEWRSDPGSGRGWVEQALLVVLFQGIRSRVANDSQCSYYSDQRLPVLRRAICLSDELAGNLVSRDRGSVAPNEERRSHPKSCRGRLGKKLLVEMLRGTRPRVADDACQPDEWRQRLSVLCRAPCLNDELIGSALP